MKKASASFAVANASLIEPSVSSSASLNAPRKGHSATAHVDGKVLIVGGENADGFVTAAEIFDPATGSFSVSGSLNTPRADHTATRLSDGRVLIAGGRGGSGSLNSTEIFDPASGVFTSGPDLNEARAGQSATVLGDGRIVFTGGDAAGSVEIYDPQGNSFSSVGANLNSPRAFHGAALLKDGTILIVGGTAADGSPVQSGEIFNVSNSAFSAVGNQTEDPRVSATLRVLHDGKVQIIGGSDHDDMEIYDPAINSFGAHAHVFPSGDSHPELVQQILSSPIRAALFRNGVSDPMLDRSRQTITELPGSNRALVTGGVDSNGNTLNSVSILNSSPATVSTDALDYPPGTPVFVSGTGWQPNESVTVTLHEDPHVDTENPHTFTVQADANGDFTFQQYAPEDGDVGVSYIAAAVGQLSSLTAQTSFHDSNGAANVNFATSGLPAGASVTVNMTIVNNGGNTITPSVTFTSPGPSVDTGADPGSEFSYSFPSSVTVGGTTYNFSSGSPSSPSTIGASGSSITVIGTYGPACTSPAVTTQPTNQIVTYGANASFTAAASGSPSPTVQWQQNTGSGFVNIGGATSATYTVNTPTVAMSGTQYRAVFTSTCGGTQTATSSAATLTVNAASVTASVTASNKTYDGNTTAAITGCTLSGVLAGDTVNVTCSAAGANTFANANVGTGKTVTATNIGLSGSASGNYSLSSTSATTTADITTKAITATLTASDKTYDGTATEPDASMNCSLSGVLAGDDTNVACTATSGTFNSPNVATANLVTATVSISGTAAGNYTLGSAGTATSSTSATATAHITAKTLTASIIGNPTKTYDGNTNATLTPANFSLSGLVAGESFTVTQTAGTYNSADVASATTVTASLSAGDFTPGVGTTASNYTLPTTASGAGHINAAHPTLSTTGGTFTYDGNPHASVGTAKGVDGTSDVAGSFSYTYTPPGNSTAPVNASATPYAVIAAFTSSDSNYDNGTPAINSITINKAGSTTVVTCDAGPFVYDGSAQTPCTATATGAGSLSVSVTVVYGNNTGAGTATADATYAGDVNHDGSTATQKTFEIEKVAATVKADNKNKTYGDANSPLTATVTGTVNSETLNYTLATTADTTSGVGDYPITVTLGSNPNYSITPTDGTLTVGMKAATVSANAKSKTYGEANPALTATVGGAVNGDTLNYTLATTATQFSDVGSYSITVALGSNSNYSVTSTNNTLTVGKANQTITWNNPAAITYGTALSGTQLNATAAGVTGGSAPGALTYSPGTGTILTAGPHTLSVDAAATQNYSAAHKDVTITVNKALLTVTADNKNMLFGGSVPAFTVSYSGFIAGEGAGDLGGTLTYTVKDSSNNTVVVSAGTPAGNYTIIPSGLASNNYTISYVNGTLTIGAWTLRGFYQPVDMSITAIVWNTVKGGSTVPLKFNLFAGSVEKTSTSDIFSFLYADVPCTTTGFDDAVDTSLLTSGGTVLRYSGTPGLDGQFIQNWQTPKTPGRCYKVAMTAKDGTSLIAFFKTK